MEQTSRKEKFQRKRSHSKNKNRRRLATTVLIVSFFALAILLWVSYNGVQNQEATPPGQTADPGSSSGGNVPAGKPDPGANPNPGSGDVPATGTPNKPGDKESAAGSSPGSTGGTPADSGKTPVPTEPNGNGSSAGTDDPNRVQLTFVGDVIFADNVEATLKRNGYDYPYKQVQSYLENADLTIANLETPITERGTAQIKQYAYRSTPAALPAFKQAGVDLVNLANNHVLDYGTTGLLDTFSHLDKNGIRWFGAGRNVTEAFKPVIMETKGMKIAFIGLSKVVPTPDWKAGKNTPGVADTYALTLPLQTIEKAKKEADLVVVVAHWGLERHDMPEAYQKDYARQYIDAGADLIIGGHPHVLQGFENYKGKWIAYSLGNFIFTMNEDPVTWETVILQASCSKDGGCELKAVPVLTKLANPEPMSEEAAAELFKRLTDISFGAQISKEGIISTK